VWNLGQGGEEVTIHACGFIGNSVLVPGKEKF
jgi:hypothetical protein